MDPASFDATALHELLASARRPPHNAHAVVVFIHWGPNWRWEPDADIRALGKALVGPEGGADLVFGHSPHHLQVHC